MNLRAIFRRVDAARIGSAAKLATDRILAAYTCREQVDRPLFVLIGENHYMPSHRIAAWLVARALKEQGVSLAVGIEQPHNTIDYMLPPGLLTRASFFLKPSEYNRKSLCQTVIREKRSEESPVSKMYVNTLFLEGGYAVSLIDAASTQLHYLDQGDSLTFRHINQGINKKICSNIHVAEKDGLYVRNLFMKERMKEQAFAAGADIFIVICGIAHVAGFAEKDEPGDKAPYNQSIASLCRQEGMQVLTLPLLTRQVPEAAIPSESKNTPLYLDGPVFGSYSKDGDKERLWLQGVLPALSCDVSILENIESYRSGYALEIADWLSLCRSRHVHNSRMVPQ